MGAGDCVWPFMTGSISRKTLVTTVQFFALQHRYFWGRGLAVCSCCGKEPASLTHLLCKCPATVDLRWQFDIPSRSEFLRVHLLTKSSKQLHSLAVAFEDRLARYKETSINEGRASMENGQVVGCPDQDAHAGPSADGGGRSEVVWEVMWDGSFGEGAGIGITIARDGRLILRAAIPVYATDATRCEALGPALAALLLARLPWKFVRFKGDSHTVVRLLR